MKISRNAILFTFIGGAIGTYLRLVIGSSVDSLLVAEDEIQLQYLHLLTLLIVNVLGAALLGWFNASAWFSADWSKALFATGFAGGFTTMSGVALWLAVEASFSLEAGFMVMAMFVLGLISYWLVFSAVSKLVSRKRVSR